MAKAFGFPYRFPDAWRKLRDTIGKETDLKSIHATNSKTKILAGFSFLKGTNIYSHLCAIITSLHDTELNGGTESVSILRRVKKFLIQNIRDDLRAQPVSYSMVTEGSTAVVKSKQNC
jgi:hypothetical protein